MKPGLRAASWEQAEARRAFERALARHDQAIDIAIGFIVELAAMTRSTPHAMLAEMAWRLRGPDVHVEEATHDRA